MYISFYKKNTLKYIITFLLLYVIFLFVFNPDKYITSVYNGFIMFAVNVLPALFPFFFLTKLLTYTGNVSFITDIMKKPVNKLFKLPAHFSYIFFMSILSGYPVGAKLVSETTQGNKSAVTRLAAVCSTSGPVFIIGTIGFAMLGNKLAGFIIYASHIISVLIFAAISGLFCKNNNTTYKQPPAALSEKALSDSVYGSIMSILTVGGFIALFYMFIDMLGSFILYGGIENLISQGFTAIGLPNKLGSGLLSGLIEATRGCNEISLSSAPITATLCLMSFLITFGGMCIMLQSFAFLGKKISYIKFIMYKFIQGLIAAGLCIIICAIFSI